MIISKKSCTYAQALFELNSEESFFQELRILSEIFIEDSILDFFLSFTVSKEKKRKLMDKTLEKASPLLKNFFYILLDHRSFSLLPQIVNAYRELKDEKDQICRGTVFSASALSVEQKRKLEEALEKFFNKKIKLSSEEDKELMAGFYINAGGYIIDNTVKNYLRQFKTSGGV